MATVAAALPRLHRRLNADADVIRPLHSVESTKATGEAAAVELWDLIHSGPPPQR
eukprot:CAMPEP_0183320116 /NCGR_PEP_ID=MMETSP0160_2-20130417/65456_1 /TAXON_ID=2839 ORGANISM="Odontella Sinensis, Strain Grunow 1884" /NCGR_SAMPLE_ID=MMETSP0160_2 /ASSEMBLY_ACC=CAM_ASM_000250 /LENGTH=54 /DNA_ID=CAMNT_0025486743 /DNA_START=52 /DNA_END=213 /DNA_ORIENTATION=-